MHAVAIVAAAGSGSRLGADLPKALVPLAGRPLVAWAVEGLRAGGVADVVVTAPAGRLAEFADALGSDARVVEGGATRTDSVRTALATFGDGPGAVLVHDAARALTPPDVVARVLAALAAGAPAVVPVLPAVDTTVVVDSAGMVTGALPRQTLRRVQTPQGFDRSVLVRAYDRLPPGADLTDDAAVVHTIGVRVSTVPGDERAAKITVRDDLELAALRVAR